MRYILSIVLLYWVTVSNAKEPLVVKAIRKSAATAVLTDGSSSPQITIARNWKGNTCHITITNKQWYH